MFLNNRIFFEHRDEDATTLVRVYCCPCCGHPTLTEPGGYEICEICSWEDDGSDGGGPNACSLDEAQGYYRRYLTSYSPTHEYAPQFQTPERKFVHDGECQPGRLEYKRRLIARLEEYMAESDLHQRGRLRRSLFRA